MASQREFGFDPYNSSREGTGLLVPRDRSIELFRKPLELRAVAKPRHPEPRRKLEVVDDSFESKRKREGFDPYNSLPKEPS